MEKSTKIILWAVGIIAIALLGWAYISGFQSNNSASVVSSTLPSGDGSAAVACAMDVKQCPDGSYVGRTGSKCEFVCPSVSTTTKAIYPADLLK